MTVTVGDSGKASSNRSHTRQMDATSVDGAARRRPQTKAERRALQEQQRACKAERRALQQQQQSDAGSRPMAACMECTEPDIRASSIRGGSDSRQVVLLVRHGEGSHNVRGRSSWKDRCKEVDPKLTAKGEEQSRALVDHPLLAPGRPRRRLAAQPSHPDGCVGFWRGAKAWCSRFRSTAARRQAPPHPADAAAHGAVDRTLRRGASQV